MATLTVQAAGTTTPNNWSLAAGASKQAAVNAPDDDATSYISSGTTANTVQTFTCSPGLSAGDTITQIDINIRYRRPAAGSNANFVVGYSFTKSGGGTQSGTSGTYTATATWQGTTYSHSSLSAVWGSGFTFYCENTQARDVWISTLEVTFTYTPGSLQTLTGAFISAASALYGGALHAFNTLTGAHRSSTATLYAGTLKGKNTLTGAHIPAGHVLYAGAINTTAQTLSGAFIGAGHTLYAGGVHRGALRIAAVTHYEGSGISAASFDHETPAGDDRLLVVVAVYKDTAGLASLIVDDGLNSPNGVAIDNDGNIYITSFADDSVRKYDAAGVFVLEWGTSGTGNGEFIAPTGVAVDGAGDVYVVDRNNHRVQKFNSSGVYQSQFGSNGTGDGEFNKPYRIAIDSSGNLYVTDAFNSRVQKFDSGGNYITQWGGLGAGDGQFGAPRGIAIDPDDYIYVTDVSYVRIQKFDTDGNYILQWGGDGWGNGEFIAPVGIAAGTGGDIYVVDSNPSRVQRFTRNGSYVSKWGTFGIGTGQFSEPVDIATDSAGNVYVADSNNDRIQKFNAGLKLNTARYGGEEMQVGPLVDSGSYFVAFYTMENPPVGAAEVAFAAPTEPDIIMLTAISLTGVDTAGTDYDGAGAGMAQAESHTTQLQVSHNRTYPTNTLSLFALLYESAGVTLTPVAGNFVWLERNVGNLRLALGLRPTADGTTANLTFGATAGAAVAPLVSSVLHIEGKRGALAGAFIGPTAEVFAGVMTRPGQYLQGAFIGSGYDVYGGALVRKLAGAFIDSTAELYAGEIVAIPGAAQVLEGAFIGSGTPRVMSGAFIEATLELFAGELFSLVRIEGEFIEAGSEVFAGEMGEPINRATGRVFAGTLAHV